MVYHLLWKTGCSTVVINGTPLILNGNIPGDALVPFPRLFLGRWDQRRYKPGTLELVKSSKWNVHFPFGNSVWEFCSSFQEILSAFHLNGKIGFPGGKPNGTGLSTENFSKKREYLQRYSSFFVFTGITGKSLYHLLYHTSTMLLGKNKRFRSRMASSFMFECPICGFHFEQAKRFLKTQIREKAILPFGH